MELQVPIEKRKAFESVAMKWHRLIKVIGWKDLADMYVRRVPPFDDVQPLKGRHREKLRQAKKILLQECILELREAGLEVKKAGGEVVNG